MATYTDLARMTPASRDRYVDFLRAFSICVVVLGHLTMAVVVLQHGQFQGTNLLKYVRGSWIITWFLQVMPVFFFVGGFSNSVTMDSIQRKGGGYVDFIHGRIIRLMKPVLILLAVWFPIAFLLQFTSLSENAIHNGTKLISQPLWFIAAYLMVVAFAPPMLRLHRKFAWKVPAGLAALAGFIDFARFNGLHLFSHGYKVLFLINPLSASPVNFLTATVEKPIVANLNVIFVWLFAQQLGFFFADGTLLKIPKRFYVIAAGLFVIAMALLTTIGPYPKSMVGLPGQLSNMNPPSICLVALTGFQVALAMLARAPVSRWLQSVRVWAGVIAVNSVIMTIFLWHLTALLICVVTLYPRGFPQPKLGSTEFFWLRPFWVIAPLIVLIPFVLVFGRFERPKAGRTVRAWPGHSGVVISVAATVLIILGVGSVSNGGIAPLSRFSEFLGIGGEPLLNLVHILVGLLLLQLAVSFNRYSKLIGAFVGLYFIALGIVGEAAVLGAFSNTASIFGANRGTDVVRIIIGLAVLGSALATKRRALTEKHP